MEMVISRRLLLLVNNRGPGLIDDHATKQAKEQNKFGGDEKQEKMRGDGKAERFKKQNTWPYPSRSAHATEAPNRPVFFTSADSARRSRLSV